MGHEYFVFKTSFAQERLWFLDQFAPGNPFYNIHVAIPVDGADAAVVRRCLQEIVGRHEALRTTFLVLKGELVQAVAPALELELPVVDLTGRSTEECEQLVNELSREESQRPFDLATGPLLRVVLVRLDRSEAVLLFTIHHIVSDGWSMDVFSREFRTLYDAFSMGRSSPLRDLPIQYPDFAAWQREWLKGDVLTEQLSFWTAKLASAPALLELPADRPRPAVQSYVGAYQSSLIAPGTVDALRRLAQREGATMFMALAAAFALLLHRYTQQEDIVLGTPIANRHRPEVQDLIGFFVNTLVLRTDLSGAPSFRDLLHRMREVALGAYQHQDLPFERLVAELARERHLSHSPIFQVMFVHQTSLEDRPLAAGPYASTDITETESGAVEQGTSKFDLTLFTSETETGHLATIIEYNTDLFDDARMTRMLAHFNTLLNGIVANPDAVVGTLPLLTDAELVQLSGWAGTTRNVPHYSTIHALVAARAAERPEAVAVVFGDEVLTYGELVTRAGALAHRLQQLGAGRNVLVAVSLERSLDLIVALLAVLAAGAAYVPLDPGYPAPRLAFMLEDAGAPIVITHCKLLERLPPLLDDTRVVVLDDVDERARIAELAPVMLEPDASADDLAYVMYTSGSTGRPKGVAITHRGVVRLVRDTDYVTLNEQETILQFAPVSFDASTFEIWGALTNGGRLVVSPPRLISIDELGDLVERHRVTTMWLTASVFQEIAEGDLHPYRSVQRLLAGGDVLSPVHVRAARAALPNCRIINGYGPTEGTTFTCCHEIGDADLNAASMPIGRPIKNTTVRVLDRGLQPVPAGIPGELFIGGDGLARGYWNADELTAERFVRDPWSDLGARLYRTGDMVQYREDGVLTFLGRRDHQVKVRGFRVELGEVEVALRRHPDIAAAAVLSRGEGSSKRLVAHVATAARGLTVGRVRDFLIGELPDHMVPSAFFITSRLPLTPSGKLDREALARIDSVPRSPDEAYAAPSTEVERAIVDVWQQVLGRDRVGADDNFFELGGNSLLMVRAQRKLRDTLRTPLSLVELFQYPTIRTLADHVAVRVGRESGDDRTENRIDERASRQREAARQRMVRATARRQEFT